MVFDPSPLVPEKYNSITFFNKYKIIVQDGHTFYVNADILAAHSPVFQELFFGDFSEPPKEELQFPDETVTSLSLFLKLLEDAFKHIQERTVAELKDLMRMTNKFDVAIVRLSCHYTITYRLLIDPNMDAGTVADLLGMVIDNEHIDYEEVKWSLVDRLTEQPITKLVEIKLWERVKDSTLNDEILKMSIKNCEAINANLHTLVHCDIRRKCNSCDSHSWITCSKCSMYFCDNHNPTSLMRCPGKPTKYKIDRNLFTSV